MELITFVGDWTGKITVHDGQVSRSKPHWQAPGLTICIRGIPLKFYPQACNMACNEAIARHIPVISLRRITK